MYNINYILQENIIISTIKGNLLNYFKYRRITLFIIFIFILFLQINSLGQSKKPLGTSINVAYYCSFREKPDFRETISSDEKYELHEQVAVWLGFFRPLFLDDSKPNRWGLRYSFLSVEGLHWRSTPYSKDHAARIDYKMFAFQPFVQQRIYGGDYFQMLVDLSGGLSFVYSSRESEIAFFILPGDLTVRINSQVGLLFVIPISKTVGLQFGPRYQFQPGKKQPNFPFHSAFLFNVGLILGNQ